MRQAHLLLAIDSDGGIIALYGDSADENQPRYRVLLLEQAPAPLIRESEAHARRDSGWLPSWAAAMQTLGQYPWPHLESRFVDPSVGAAVWEALQDYVDRTGHSPIPSAWGHWRRACIRPHS